MRRLFSFARDADELEPGLIFSTPEAHWSDTREVVLAFDEEDYPGAASVGFSGLTFRCGHGSATAESLARAGVDVAPREWWSDIRGALYGEEPIDYLFCDVGERKAGRVLLGDAAAPRGLGDEWIAQQLSTSPLLRYRWREVERNAPLDGALQRMVDGDDDEVMAAALGLEAPKQKARWKRSTQPPAPRAWTSVADVCRGILAAQVARAPSGWTDEYDAARELRLFAASMFDGPIYVPGLWPETIDRIVLQLDKHG